MSIESDRPIVVAVDFTPCSRAALAVARELATAGHAPLLIVHVLSDAALGGAAALAIRAVAHGLSPDELAISEAVRKLDDFLRDAGPATAGERTRIEVGPAAAGIVRVADVEHARIVVIGTHGRGRIGQAVLGSVARDVMHQSTRRVIAVHEASVAGVA